MIVNNRRRWPLGAAVLALACAAVLISPATGLTKSKHLGFKPGDYAGTTSQNLPVSFTAAKHKVTSIEIGWRATCSDGQTRTSSSNFGTATYPIHKRKFTATATFTNGAHATFKGRLKGKHAHGTYNRSGPITPGVTCATGTFDWSARHS
jgi:hypothetical protein